MAVSRPTLTPDHRDLLQHFVSLVDAMVRCRFIEMFDKQTRCISFEMEHEGAISITPPDYDWEGFQAFLTTFRQVCVSKNEPVYLFRITQIINNYASPEFKRWIAAVEGALRPILEGKHQYRYRLYWQSTAGQACLTSAQILDALINGRIFHADKKHRPTVKFLEGLEKCLWLWPVVGDFIKPGLYGCMFFYCQLMRDGILGQADYPEGCRIPEPI